MLLTPSSCIEHFDNMWYFPKQYLKLYTITMSLTDEITSVQGIALSALQAAANINTYLSTFVAPDIGGMQVASFNNT